MALMATQKASRTPPMAVEAVAPPGRDKKLAALMASQEASRVSPKVVRAGVLCMKAGGKGKPAWSA